MKQCLPVWELKTPAMQLNNLDNLIFFRRNRNQKTIARDESILHARHSASVVCAWIQQNKFPVFALVSNEEISDGSICRNTHWGRSTLIFYCLSNRHLTLLDGYFTAVWLAAGWSNLGINVRTRDTKPTVVALKAIATELTHRYACPYLVTVVYSWAAAGEPDNYKETCIFPPTKGGDPCARREKNTHAS